MKKIFLLTLLVINLLASPIDDAKNLFDNIGKHKEAIEIFKKLKDNPEAQYYLGKAYLYGMGVKIDKKKAFQYTTNSANQQSSSGLNLLGLIYQYGYGVNKDELEALSYYKQSAKLGNTKAMKNIGQLYHDGDIVKKDSQKAISWFKKAIEHGDKRAYLNIGDLYFEEKKDKEALEWYLKYEKLINKNNPSSSLFYNKVGILYLSIQDYTKAYEYILNATNLGNFQYAFNLYHITRADPSSEPKQKEAVYWLEKASDAGQNKTKSLKLSQNLLYGYYLYDSNQAEEAVKLAKNAYENEGNIQLGCKVASYYANNMEHNLDLQKSYNILKEILSTNQPSRDTSSCYSTLSFMYRIGNFLAKDINKSLENSQIIFEKIYNRQYSMPAQKIADIYLKELNDFKNAEKWYKITYDLSGDEKYLTYVDAYRKKQQAESASIMKNGTNQTKQVFPIVDNFYKKEQVINTLESKDYYFISAADKSIKIYNKKTKELYKELRGWIGNGIFGTTIQMAFDEQKKLLYCANLNSAEDWSKNGIIKVFDISNGKVVKTINTTKVPKITYLDISKDGKYLVALSNAIINIINTETNEREHYNFSNIVNFRVANIVQKNNDYLINVLGNDKNLYTFSTNKKRLLAKEPFTNQEQFKSCSCDPQDIFKNNPLNIDKVTINDKKLYLKTDISDNLKVFDMEKLTFLESSEQVKFKTANKSDIKIELKNYDSTLEIYKNSQLLSTIVWGWDVRALKYKIIDDKYIIVTTTDITVMYIFNLKAEPIAQLSGFLSLQINIVYKDGYLITWGEDNTIHTWDIDNLKKLDKKEKVYNADLLQSMPGVLDMFVESDEELKELMELQYNQNNRLFMLTPKEFKKYMKMFLLKKETIYPLASLYIKDNEWLVYNKQGLYASSKNGANLIKYHLNQGLYKEAKIIKNDQIFEKFYRPDLIKKLLAKEKITIDLDLESIISNIKAPEVKIIDTRFVDKKNLELTYQICDAGNGISHPSIILNGISANIGNSRGLTVETIPKKANKCRLYKNTIMLRAGENTISIKAFDSNKTILNKSKEMEVIANYKKVSKGDLYFLSIAVAEYKNKSLTLKYPVKDAQAIKQKIQLKNTTLYNQTHIYELHDSNVTKDYIDKAFDQISKNITVNDAFILYIAGHGVSKNGLYYFLPYDINNTLPQNIEDSAISINDIKHNLSKIHTSKSLVLLDTCQSGAMVDNILNDQATITRLSHDDKRNYIVASNQNQVALEGYKNHGVFTYVALDAFENAYFGKQTNLSITNLAAYLESEVPKITQEHFHYKQIPQKYLNGINFHIGTK